jgi:chaperonin cofactor prefoldin
MNGAFYGALASSASVFVAILSALLVNNYVEIRSELREMTSELERIEEETDELETRRDNLTQTARALSNWPVDLSCRMSGLSSFGQQHIVENLEEAREIENQISTLERRQRRLERRRDGLDPEDLIPVLASNVVTIVFSVVVPVFTYLLVVTENPIPLPGHLSVLSHAAVNAFVFWLAGLAVVFDSIYARINERDPVTHVLYKRVLD